MMNLYEAMSENTRRKILLVLSDGQKNVSELVHQTGLKQPNISNHLCRLKSKELVKSEKVGREVRYFLASPEIRGIVRSLMINTEDKCEVPCFELLSEKYAKYATQGDELECSLIIEHMFKAKISLVEIYEHLLTPSMTMVGTWYKQGEINEAQEHMASEITHRMMVRTSLVMGHRPRHGKTALLGCGPNNYHVLGISMIGDLLRLEGWKTISLGANTPIHAFVESVKTHKPDLVLVSCVAETSSSHCVELVRSLGMIKRVGNHFVLGAGGRIVISEHAKFRKEGVDFISSSLEEFATKHLPSFDRFARKVKSKDHLVK